MKVAWLMGVMIVAVAATLRAEDITLESVQAEFQAKALPLLSGTNASVGDLQAQLARVAAETFGACCPDRLHRLGNEGCPELVLESLVTTAVCHPELVEGSAPRGEAAA